RVGPDVVAQHRVAATVDPHTGGGVPGDDVTCAGCGAADGVPGGAIADSSPRPGVSEGGSPSNVGADVIALNAVVMGAARDGDALRLVARDNVTRSRCRPTDGVVGGTAGHRDAVVTVAQVSGAAGVRADVVALEQVVVATRDVHSVEAITRDDVTR